MWRPLFAFLGAALSAVAEASGFFQILYDTSTPSDSRYRPDFGYAVYVEYAGRRILMDTGTDPVIMAHNLDVAGVAVDKLDAIVMTHNHTDHTGALAQLRARHPQVPVYVPPGQAFSVGEITPVVDSRQIAPGLWVIRGHTDKPTAGISDDLSLVVATVRGLYVLSSCSHSGVGQIVDRARSVAGAAVHYFSGGARLVFRPEPDTVAVAQALTTRNVELVSPSHCSLSHRVDTNLRGVLNERLVPSQLGVRVALPSG